MKSGCGTSTTANSLKELITHVNTIRKATPGAATVTGTVRFHPTDNERLIAYSKTSEDFSDMILVVVNLNRAQHGSRLGLGGARRAQARRG